MFKFIFKTIIIVIILTILTITLAVWKGGEAFWWIGEKVETAGKSIRKFGDMVEGFKKGKKKVADKLLEIKENFDSIRKRNSEPENGRTDKNKKP